MHSKKRYTVLGVGVLLALLAAGIIMSNGLSRQREKKNVIIVLADTLRADHLGMFGYDRDTSPNLDEFARENILYRDAISASSWTPPSVASILTGMYAGAHRLMPPNGRKQAKKRATRLDDSLYTLPETLRDQGYATIGITPNPWISKDFGFDQGFDEFIHLSRNAYADEITDEGVEALESLGEGGEPFFLYLHYFDPHNPYAPKEEFRGRYSGPSSTGAYPKKLLRKVNRYDAEIAFMDREIDRFFSYLKQEGLYEDSVIIFVADHGEQFKEHGGLGHGLTVYDQEVRVPLILKTDAPASEVETTVSTADIYPTILDIIGMEVPETVQGVSLLDDEAINARLGVISEISRIEGYRAFVQRNGVKLILDTHRPKEGEKRPNTPPSVVGVFDRRDDPQEKKPLENQSLIETLRERERKVYSEILLQRRNPETTKIDQEKLEELQSLGYLN